MSEQEFLEKMKNILDEETVRMEDYLYDFDGWDSISMMSFYLSEVKKTDKKVSLISFRNVETVKDLYELMK